MATKSTIDPKGVKGMEEPVPGAQMPAGKTGEEAVASEIPAGGMGPTEGNMPAPGMGVSTSAGGEMPTGSMGEPKAAATDMPAAGMAEPAAIAVGMPAGSMGEGESGVDRFRP